MEQNSYPSYGHINDICLIGHGSIGKGTLPLLKRHFKYDKLTIIDPNPVSEPVIEEKMQFLKIGLTKQNFKEVLDKVFTGKVCFCVNLSIDVSSCELTLYCQRKGVLYIDTVKQEWKGYFELDGIDLAVKGNYASRDQLLRLTRQHQLKTTAISCCGANPGMVNWLVKEALLNLAKDLSFPLPHTPQNRQEWASLMRDLGVKGLHVAERDTQRSNLVRPVKEFWNTWSCHSFILEGYYQPSELGWGTHEKWFPDCGREFPQGCKAAIYLTKPGMNVPIKGWCPTYGPQFSYLVSHDESISIANFFTVTDSSGQVLYRPTCHYAYHPCEDALNSAIQSIGAGAYPTRWKILEEEIVEGMDELGVFLYGHAKNAYWYGSQLDIHETRKRAPNQNATALQVTSSVIAGMAWAMENREAGVVEADEMDFKRCLDVARPYIGPLKGYYTDWTPLTNRRNYLADEEYDLTDPWQFKNVLLHK